MCRSAVPCFPGGRHPWCSQPGLVCVAANRQAVVGPSGSRSTSVSASDQELRPPLLSFALLSAATASWAVVPPVWKGALGEQFPSALAV